MNLQRTTQPASANVPPRRIRISGIRGRKLSRPATYCLPPTICCLLLFAFGFPASPATAQSVTVSCRVALIPPAGRRHSADNSNAVVWLTPLNGLGSAADSVEQVLPHGHFRLLQKGKHFDPHVLAVPVGSTVDFPNLDPFFHNVFSLFEGKRFDLGLYEAGTTHSVRFDRPGVCYIFCNIHPEMSAVVVVLQTPYYGISNRAGAIVIPNVPPGRYELEVWQERCLPQSLVALRRAVTISQTSASLGSVSLTESTDLLGSHKNKYGQDYDNPTPPSPVYDQP